MKARWIYVQEIKRERERERRASYGKPQWAVDGVAVVVGIGDHWHAYSPQVTFALDKHRSKQSMLIVQFLNLDMREERARWQWFSLDSDQRCGGSAGFGFDGDKWCERSARFGFDGDEWWRGRGPQELGCGRRKRRRSKARRQKRSKSIVLVFWDKQLVVDCLENSPLKLIDCFKWYARHWPPLKMSKTINKC